MTALPPESLQYLTLLAHIATEPACAPAGEESRRQRTSHDGVVAVLASRRRKNRKTGRFEQELLVGSFAHACSRAEYATFRKQGYRPLSQPRWRRRAGAAAAAEEIAHIAWLPSWIPVRYLRGYEE